MFGRRFIAVGATCVDAERTRRFLELGLWAWRQRKAAGSRSIARPLARLDSRGTVATHGGIGLEDDVHRRIACNVKVDVASGGTSFGPPWLVHITFTLLTPSRIGPKINVWQMDTNPVHVVEIVSFKRKMAA